MERKIGEEKARRSTGKREVREWEIDALVKNKNEDGRSVCPLTPSIDFGFDLGADFHKKKSHSLSATTRPSPPPLTPPLYADCLGITPMGEGEG